MNLDQFATLMEEVSDASGGNAKGVLLENAFKYYGPDELEVFTRVALGELFDEPSRNTNVSTARVLSAASSLTGVDRSEIDEIVDAHGKPSYGVEYAMTQRTQTGVVSTTASLEEIYELICDLPEASGDKAREDIVQTIFAKAEDPNQAKWLSYCLLNDLSLGIGWKSVAKAFAQAEDLEKDEVYKSRQVLGIFPKVVNYYYAHAGLRTKPVIGEPFNGMLAQAGKPASEYENGWVAQTKYDGARVFIHNSADDVRLYSRGRQDVTESLPEIVEPFEHDDTPMILDTEVVAFKDGKVSSFQNVLKRFRREDDIEEIMQEIGVKAYIFDILHLDGEWIMDEPAYKRYDLIPPRLGNYRDLEVAVMSNDIESLYQESLDKGHEGVIAKRWDAPWVFERSDAWQKLKPTETLDLKVAGLKPGTGKHADKLGAFELETGDGVSLGNVGTGLSDEDREKLDTPDMVGEIIEIKTEELQKTDNGYGLRFPRFEAVRDDKEEADDLQKVKTALNFEE